ncbi:hypothetical protein SEUCBS139899_000229 [Sporothrix eucalyptigena]|uniref:Cytochrome P450 n=1 Tax=Sporothrix eucalyptigena TaxID=1812306 RepID=A0ABP0BN26_9PEZI
MAQLDGHQMIYAAAGLLLALVLISAFRTPVIRRNGIPLRKPPNTLPLVGNGILFLQARQKLFAWFVKCQRQFGYETFQVAVPTLPPGIVINDPRNLEFIFKNEGSLISKGSFVKGMLWDLFGHGIVNADGEVWRTQRKAGSSFLNTANIRVLTDVALPQYLDDTLRYLRRKAEAAEKRDKAAVDLQAVFHELTSCIMGRMAYNMEMHADDEFTVAFDYASGITTERFQNPLWFITETISGSADLRQSLAVVKAFGHRIVSTAVADRKAQHGGLKDSSTTTSSKWTPSSTAQSASAAENKINEVSGSLIQSLLDAISDQDVVADAALNYLSAGRDTVAQGLTWTFYMLMKNPQIVDKIRQEVQRVLFSTSGDAATSKPDGHNLDFARLTPAAMPYTMAVFYEGLRLFPPIPFEIKQVEADHLTLPDGTELSRGALVIWCSWALNRSYNTWGDDADVFRPERWLTVTPLPSSGAPKLPNTGASLTYRLVSRSASEFPVFHGGPRTCLGKKMAESMAVQTMAAVAWFFDLELAEPNTERVTKTSLTLPMEGGLPCFVRVRLGLNTAA